MSNPNCIFCQSDGSKEVKKAHYWTKEPLSKFEFGGGETVIRTAEAKNKIMISFHGSRDRTSVPVKPSSNQVAIRECNFRDIGNLRFCGGHFEKWPKLVVSPSFLHGDPR